MAKRAMAWLLTVLLLLGLLGCAPAPGPSATMAPATPAPAPSPTPVPSPTLEPEPIRRTVPFSQMTYTRPDSERFLRETDACMLDFYDCDSVEEQIQVFQRFRALVDDTATMQAIAYIHNNMDYYNEYWAAEYAYCATLTSIMTAAFEAVCDILQRSRFRSELEAVLDPIVFMQSADRALREDAELMEITTRENQLVNGYSQLLATATVEQKGAALTLAQASAAGNDALTAWLKANNEPLAQYYCELIQVRKQQAERLGYASYAGYQYALKGRDYTPEMARALREEVKAHIAPLYERLRDTGHCYDPKLTVSLYDAMGFLHETLPALSDRFAPPLSLMLDNELYDLLPRTGKRNGGFTSYLYSYDAPFLLMSFQEDSASLLTLIHEFGHFCDFYTDPRRLERSSTDVTEQFSQALELLLLPYLDRLFTPEEARALSRYALLKALNVYVYQSYWDAFQEEVYGLADEEITVDNINAIARRLCKEYGISLGSRYLNEHYWVTLSHNYESPFYTFTYVTSVDAALQLYLMAQENQNKAVETYFSLFDRKKSEDFLGNLEAAGLENPFEEAHGASMAAALWAQAETLLAEEEFALDPAA